MAATHRARPCASRGSCFSMTYERPLAERPCFRKKIRNQKAARSLVARSDRRHLRPLTAGWRQCCIGTAGNELERVDDGRPHYPGATDAGVSQVYCTALLIAQAGPSCRLNARKPGSRPGDARFIGRLRERASAGAIRGGAPPTEQLRLRRVRSLPSRAEPDSLGQLSNSES